MALRQPDYHPCFFDMFVKSLRAKTIISSQGRGTLEAELETNKGIFRASVPSGISKSRYEAVAVEPERAVENIKKIIAPALLKKEFKGQKGVDDKLLQLDGTKDKSGLGANTLLAVSVCFLRASAFSKGIPLWQEVGRLSESRASLPKPLLLLAEGGGHGEGRLAVQEFMALSEGEGFKQSFEKARRLYGQLERFLAGKFSADNIGTGAEGGFTPPAENTLQMLDLIVGAVEEAGLKKEVKVVLDVASSEFFQQGRYYFEGKERQPQEMASFYETIINKYPIFALEDPFSQEDWLSWREFKAKLASREREVLLAGDDLTATNPERIKKAREENAVSAVILKPNQIGTISETIEAALLAKSFGWKVIVSHRGEETEDNLIADLAVGLAADYIKAGGPFHKERKAKYDRLLEIEKELAAAQGKAQDKA